MPKVKFRSNVAEFLGTKTPNGYAGSGLSHHFFYWRTSFSTYKAIKKINVQTANATFKIVGEGTVTLPIENVINFEAYNPLKFLSRLISLGLLQKSFEIFFPC